MACFADSNVSQGSVATYARCGGSFNIRFTTNLLKNFQWNFFESVEIWQNYGHESVAPLFWPALYNKKPYWKFYIFTFFNEMKLIAM